MIKRDEVTNETSCLNRATPEEMIFVLLARDVAAPAAIRGWCAERVRLQKNTWQDEQIQNALACASEMVTQRLRASHD